MFFSEWSSSGLGDPRLQRQQRFSATNRLHVIIKSRKENINI